ncbi:acetyl-coenzyme A synthetase [Advenella kashmirensis WT001]|uniref:Acetyl-coenzyme A synthetase n=1 Tax=Advenella kashmirensis (strain DSM 17095 / LMG 22695 / WT001) TaxID=1036672 RepID=I3UDQ7_ADVKW|nr:AMP-binding protein [Advenella kashmirensis]AFK63145.1 acetyl-coenzyme A synthetase [Advenella kashmirensis WT001]
MIESEVHGQQAGSFLHSLPYFFSAPDSLRHLMTDHYSSLYKSFEWLVPTVFNIADACCHRWASSPHEARQVAIYFEDQVGQLTLLTYGQLSEKVNKLANGFIRMGVQPQDRVAVALQHSAESAITQLAVLTVGAIVVPLTASLSNAEYAERLHDSQARVAVVDKHSITALISAVDNHSPVKQIIGIHTDDDRIISWRTLLARQPSTFTPHVVSASTPAILVYPATTENEPLRGVLLDHSSLIGTLPGFVASQNWFPKANDIFWTSYDWNSPNGLLNALLPTLYFGKSIVGCPAGRTIPRLFTLLEHYQITNIHASGQDLRRIREYPDTLEEFELAIRSISCLDTDYDPSLGQWAKERFNVDINVVAAPLGFGYIIGESQEKWAPRQGSMGRVYPGHRITVIDQAGKPLKTGQKGFIAVNRTDQNDYPDPAVALHYWSGAQIHPLQAEPQEWIPTAIRGHIDKDGYVWRDADTDADSVTS